MLKFRALALGAILLCATAAPAQEAPVAGPDEEPTLPPVIVLPEEAPPVESTAPSADFDAVYPGLAGQLFQGLHGAAQSDRSLFELPAMGTIVDRRQLEEKQAADMYHALENEVGVLMQQTGRGQASPFVRGLTGQQVLVLIDGVRMNTSVMRAGPNQYFNLIDPGQVERIEVIHGPQSVLWGSDALGGVINVATRGASPTRGDYHGGGFREQFSTADIGSYSRADVEGWSGPLGVFAGASYLNVNDLDRGGDLGRQPYTSYDQYAADAKFTLLLDDENVLTTALVHFEQQNVPRSDRFAPFVFSGPSGISPRPTFFDPQQRDLAYLRWENASTTALFDGFTMIASYQRNKEGSGELRSATQQDFSVFDVDTFGYTLMLAKELDAAGKIVYGGSFYYDDIDASRYRINPTLANPPHVSRPPQYPDDSLYQRAGGYVNWELPLADRLDATTGVRYESAQASATPRIGSQDVFFARSYQDWIASAGLSYAIEPELRLFGGVSEGMRAPTIDDLTANATFLQNAQAQPTIPTLDVVHEQSINYEIGLKLDAPRLRIQLVEFWTDLNDYITRRQTIDPFTLLPVVYLANSEAYLNGTELSGQLLLDDGWSLYGNFFHLFGKDVEADEPLARIPPTQGVLGLRWRDEERRHWASVYTWLVNRQERYSSLNLIDARFPPGGTAGYATLNVRAGKSWGRCDQHQLSVALENITNKWYRVLGSGVDGPGFNAVIGYDWSF